MSQETSRRYRLSPQQRHLWVLQQADGDDPYRTQGVILIEGNIEKQKLLQAVEIVVDEIEILRTVFDRLPTMTLPFQLVSDSVKPRVSTHDLTGLEPHRQEAEISKLLRQFKEQPFDFAKGPLLKLGLVELSRQKHVLLVEVSSLCMDERGLENLTRALSRAYSVQLNKESTDDPIQYADIAEWHNELLEAEERQTGRDYWRRRDWDALSELRLPFEPRQETDAKFRFDTVTASVEHETLAKVEALSRVSGTTTGVFLLACWYLLLGRLTGKSEVTIGAGLDGRKYEELEEAVGLLAKCVPIHCRLNSTESFAGVLAQVEAQVSEAYTWQEYFNWEQVDGLNSKAADSWPRLFCFDFQEAFPSCKAGDITFTLRRIESCVDRFKIKLSCIPGAGGVLVRFQYDSNFYQVEDIERVAEEWLSLVNSAVAQPQSLIGELNVVSEAERRQLVVELNRTERKDFPRGCIHHLFEAHAADTPDRVAIVADEQQLTYGELNARANQLAHQLRRLGVAPDELVAICLDRSTEMLVAILGTIKAGGAYVPLDPAAPHDRLSYMLGDTRASVLITHERYLHLLSANEIPTICLDRDSKIIEQELRENLAEGAGPGNLVYVMYTSGSTGQPKGVAVEHRQLVNYVNGILERLALPSGSVFATVSTFTADLGNTSIFASLCSGGSLHVVTQELASNPEAFASYVHRHDIDCLKIVPAHLAALLTTSSWTNLLPGKRLVLGGEACGWELMDKLQTVMPPRAIINHYGPTETTVGVLTYDVEEATAARLSKTVPLGGPLSNSQVYLLDQHWRPVPTGVPGELYIGGEGVSRGYLRQPGATAEKFVPNPFSSEPGARLYRTADLARYLPDGNIEFLGRIDKQIKLHGYRIEPGEIEAALSEHPSVSENVVILREDTPGQKRLVAYIVAAQSPPATSELREFLLHKLPDYMIPAAFVMLDKLPLTANGKIDRAALPVPEQAKSGKAFVAPRTENERLLAGIWSKVLRLKQVSVNDNFFALGGDSILSIQIIARTNQAGRRLTPRQLFQHQTIAELALVLDTAPVLQDEQGTIVGEVPRTPIQHWFCERELKDPHHWNQSMLLDCPAGFDAALLEKIVRHLLRHHDALRLRFRKESGQWRQFFTADYNHAPFTQIDLSQLPESEKVSCAEGVANELQASLDLRDGPIMRVAHFDFGEGQTGKLLMIVHHLAIDGVSWRILLEDLRSAYRQAASGQTISWPPKTTSFKRWAEQLETYAQSESLRQEKNFWLGELSKQTGRIPLDFAEGENTVALTQHVTVSLSDEETYALLQNVPAAYHTQINDVLLTALTEALARWSDESSVLIEVEGHGREEIVDGVDLSRTVGWFTTRFPVRLEHGASSDPGVLLMSVKEHLRSIPNNGIGYGLLRYLSTDQETAAQFGGLRHPDISFNYLGQFQETHGDDDLFRVIGHGRGSMRSPRDERRHVLEVNAIVTGGQLQAVWSYSSGIHLRAAIENVARDFLSSLRSLIEHCKSPGARGYTPSDFPLVNLNQEQLEKIFARLSKHARGH